MTAHSHTQTYLLVPACMPGEWVFHHWHWAHEPNFLSAAMSPAAHGLSGTPIATYVNQNNFKTPT